MSAPVRRAPRSGDSGYSAHVDYVDQQAIISSPSGTTFLSWGDEGSSAVLDIIRDRFGPEDRDKRAVDGRSA